MYKKSQYAIYLICKSKYSKISKLELFIFLMIDWSFDFLVIYLKPDYAMAGLEFSKWMWLSLSYNDFFYYESLLR